MNKGHIGCRIGTIANILVEVQGLIDIEAYLLASHLLASINVDLITITRELRNDNEESKRTCKAGQMVSTNGMQGYNIKERTLP